MPTTQTQLRRGTASQVAAFTPVEGEVVVDLTNDRLVLGDGLVVGGKSIFPSTVDIQNGIIDSNTAGGTANAITVTLSPAPGTSYVTRQRVVFMAASDNTSNVTINVNTIGAVALKKATSAGIIDLVANDIKAGAPYSARYNSSLGCFVLEASGGASVSITAGDGLTGGTITGTGTIAMNTANVGGVGAYCLMINNGFTAVPGGVYTAMLPAQLTWTGGTGTSVIMSTPTGAPGGSWRYYGLVSIPSGSLGIYQRIA